MSYENSLAPKMRLFNSAVLISALGYFVDIYDLVLFSIVRVRSLQDLGVADGELLNKGVELLNLQMAGMLVGGIIWGVIGDKRGRISVLFGSILLYSFANLANAFVHSTNFYGALRFIAGIGLAGELGAAITLVSETLPKETRGYGTSIVAAVGVSGAALAAFIGQRFDWRIAYFVGGIMGLTLLVLRVRTYESKLFDSLKFKGARRGDLMMLFRSRDRFLKYLSCVLLGVPIWFVIGVLVTFSPEICRELDVTGEVHAGTAIFYAYLGLIVGDIGSGILSQILKSRKRAIYLFLALTALFVGVFLTSSGLSPASIYGICFAMGCGIGYWALFVTIAAEQFGTNIRATVTTTVPNFVRGSVIIVTVIFQRLSTKVGLVDSAVFVGFGCVCIALGATYYLQESFGRDLDFLEE